MDNVQQRGVPVAVNARVEYMPGPNPVPNPAQADRDLTAHLLDTIRTVIGQKMATGQLTFRNLGEGSIGGAADEIVAASGLAAHGIQISNLTLQFAIDGGGFAAAGSAAARQRGAIDGGGVAAAGSAAAGQRGSIDGGAPQYEVRAHIHVGGFNINASSKGGVDVGGVANQAIDKAKSAILWWAIGGLLTLAIVGGVTWYIKHTISKAVTQTMATVSGADIVWDGKTPLTCTGSQNLTFKGVTAKLTGEAVNATGSCTLTLVDCNITGETAVAATGSAVVTITGGSVTGTGTAVQAMGSAKVTLSGTKVSGKLQKLGSATITGP